MEYGPDRPFVLGESDIAAELRHDIRKREFAVLLGSY